MLDTLQCTMYDVRFILSCDYLLKETKDLEFL
jgi:hypothetical protein